MALPLILPTTCTLATTNTSTMLGGVFMFLVV